MIEEALKNFPKVKADLNLYLPERFKFEVHIIPKTSL
jgi:hypothetical protein